MSQPGDQESCDVLIVGAGISGLAVAAGLVEAGRTPLVLEARNEVGGRLLTAQVPGGHADLGATWFWPGENRVIQLVSDLGVGVHEQWNDGDALLRTDGRNQRARFPQPLAFRLIGGMSTLTRGLAIRLPEGSIRTSSPVSRVDHVEDSIVAFTPAGQIRADAVVIALPPSLAVSSGLVSPESLSPHVAEAATNVAVWMGTTTKAVAVYNKPFWREQGLSGLAISPGTTFGEVHDMSGPDGAPAMLFGFGHADNPLRPADSESFVAHLVDLFGAAAHDPLKVVTKNWQTDVWTTPDGWVTNDRYDLFGSPHLQEASWNGKLFWSSTETSPVAPGHVEGALAASERTVKQLTQS